MPRALILLLLVAPIEARADGPWCIAFGAGPSIHRRGATAFDVGASAGLDTAYRIGDRGAVGIGTHLGIAVVQGIKDPSLAFNREVGTYVPFEAGLGAQVVILDRVLIAPWAGVVSLEHYERFTAFGVEIGADILVRGRDRLSAIATITAARYLHLGDGYLGMAAGVAFRYW